MDRIQKDSAPASARLSSILETSIYVNDLDEADRFYGGVLGLKKIFSVPGRQLVFACGDGVLLVFDPERAKSDQVVINGGILPFHGTHGAGHIAFKVAEPEFQQWRERFRVAEVAIESEVNWPNGARSVYFRDPAGNVLELATPNMWEFMPLSAKPPSS
jgi:catechol 2,3-dioxygenase-like lactoylglutathione lyase family enzyme